jgi:hypothetical protein
MSLDAFKKLKTEREYRGVAHCCQANDLSAKAAISAASEVIDGRGFSLGGPGFRCACQGRRRGGRYNFSHRSAPAGQP